jgi:hypothetical protein
MGYFQLILEFLEFYHQPHCVLLALTVLYCLSKATFDFILVYPVV